MSQQELEQTDQEVMDMVNNHSAPGSVEAAEEVARRWRQSEAKENAQGVQESEEDRAERELQEFIQHKRKKETVYTALCLAACILIAVLLVTAMYAPELITWFGNFGVLVCGIVAAVKIDRFIQRHGRR